MLCLSWKIWTLTLTGFISFLPLVTPTVAHSQTLRSCFKPVRAMTASQTLKSYKTWKKKRNAIRFPPDRDALWLKTHAVYIFPCLHHTIHKHSVIHSMHMGIVQKNAWLRPKIQFAKSKENCSRTKVEGLVSYLSKMKLLSLATRDSEGGSRGRRICVSPGGNVGWRCKTGLQQIRRRAVSPPVTADKYQFNYFWGCCHCIEGPWPFLH